MLRIFNDFWVRLLKLVSWSVFCIKKPLSNSTSLSLKVEICVIYYIFEKQYQGLLDSSQRYADSLRFGKYRPLSSFE